MNFKVILASTSTYRADLLHTAGISFETADPQVVEAELPNENPADRACRLAREKCLAVSRRRGECVVIGSDQVGVAEGEILHKPGNAEAALQQLRRCQGKQASFHTAVCVWDPAREVLQERLVDTQLQFRTFSDEMLRRYVARDRPYDCAGGFKVEAAGIALFEHVRSDDPTALQGLPMIATIELLLACGLALWTSQDARHDIQQ